ncbi:TPA: hypothetical protein ACH3X2_004432 [Trebouxia sp. C0005]
MAQQAAAEDVQSQHQVESAGQRLQVQGLQQCLADKAEQLDKLNAEHNDALEVHRSEVQQLTSQLSASTSVTTEQEAELSKKEAQVKRLDGRLSEQQAKMKLLQSLVSEKDLELQQLSAEKQAVTEEQQGMIRTLGDRLAASQQEGAAAHQEEASGAQAPTAATQDFEARIAALSTRLEEEQKDKAAAVEANEAVVQDLQGQLAEQRRTKHASHMGHNFVAQERLQVQLDAESKQNQQLAGKVAGLEKDVSRLKGQSLKELAIMQSCLNVSMEHLRLSRAELEAMSAQTQARLERQAEQHAEVVQQVQQQKDREARAHREEVTRLRDLLEVAHPAKTHTPEAAAAMPVKQPYHPPADMPHPKLAPGGAGKAVPAVSSPSANSVVGRGKTAPADPYNLVKGALSAAQASPASSPAAGSSQVRESELQSCTPQPAELQSVVEGEHAVTSDLGGSLTASQQEVAAVQQVKAKAAQAHTAASQESKGRIAALSTRLEEQQNDKAATVEEHDGRDAAVDTRLSQQDSAGVGQQECADDPTHCLSDTACEASGMHDQVDALQSSRMVDEEVDAQERHPQLHNSENRAGASSLQKEYSLSSELASSEQRQGPPKVDLYREEGRYKPPHMWPGYTPSPAATVELSYSGGAQDSEVDSSKGSDGCQLSSRLDRDIPLFRSPVSTSQGNQKHRYSHKKQQHGLRFGCDHEYEYPAARQGELDPAHPRGEGPPGFPAAPQSNGWGPGPSSSAAATEQHDDGMRPPGFPANPNRSIGMAAAQSGRQRQRHEEPSMAAAQRTQQQRQNGQRRKRSQQGRASR